MLNPVTLEPVDYLVIGHVAHDLTPEGPRLGGTVAYSALTARALGLRVGVVTAAGEETPEARRSPWTSTALRFERGEQCTGYSTLRRNWPDVADALDVALPDRLGASKGTQHAANQP